MDNTGQRERTPVQKYREAKISFEPYEKMLADEERLSKLKQNQNDTEVDESPTTSRVRDIVAKKAVIGSGSTYSR